MMQSSYIVVATRQASPAEKPTGFSVSVHAVWQGLYPIKPFSRE
jgi:hypothetical protein